MPSLAAVSFSVNASRVRLWNCWVLDIESYFGLSLGLVTGSGERPKCVGAEMSFFVFFRLR